MIVKRYLNKVKIVESWDSILFDIPILTAANHLVKIGISHKIESQDFTILILFRNFLRSLFSFFKLTIWFL